MPFLQKTQHSTCPLEKTKKQKTSDRSVAKKTLLRCPNDIPNNIPNDVPINTLVKLEQANPTNRNERHLNKLYK
jgi:hypothetical protein